VTKVTVKARKGAILLGVLVTAVVVVFSLLPMIASSQRDEVRDVRLVVRDMSFYVEGSKEPNPTLTFRAGEQVRIVLRNEDAGMDHDFSVVAWQAKTKLLEGRGEDTVLIKVPSSKGTESYTCTPHSEMMRGTIRIE
jgi:plastocyanin